MSNGPDRDAKLPRAITVSQRQARTGMMEAEMGLCESRIGGICTRPATWKQAIHAGQRDQGRLLMYSKWCDAHAGNIIQKRRRESLTPPQMTPVVVEAT